jgi:DNA polymerase-3 subunit gamma/tau
MIIDELTMHLKDMLISDSAKLNTLTIDRFFRILSDAKNLLSIGSNGEFVLTLTLFKMVESLNILDIDDAINRLQDELSIVSSSKKESVKKEITLETKQDKPKITELESTENKTNKEIVKESKRANIDLSATAKFKNLQDKIYDRNYELGELFSRCVNFVSFENNTLTWESSANEEERKVLRNSWGIIKLFVEELFGIGVKIKATQKKTLVSNEKETKLDIKPQIIEEEGQKSSCIMPEGNSDASIDKDPQELLKEPMIKSFLETFEPKRVIVKQKT